MILAAWQELPRLTSPTTIARGPQIILYAIMFPSGGTYDFQYKTVTALNGTGTYDDDHYYYYYNYFLEVGPHFENIPFSFLNINVFPVY